AGYSRLMGEDETGTLAALKAHLSALIEPTLASRNGRVVKLMGDGLLAEFASVVDAVQAAVDIQRGMADRNADVPSDRRIEFRIGINLGDVILDGDDIHGNGVNVAARMEGLAEPGGICVSGTVREHASAAVDVVFDDLGPQEVKNIAQPVRCYRVRLQHGDNIPQPHDQQLTIPDKPSIAVLPFDNMSNDPEQEYFSDGITEDIITEISRIPDVLVIARNSTFTYKGKAAKVQDVCRDLGVRYVLEGSVRKAGERVRISAQLIDGRSGGHLWAERYDRGLKDIFAVQDDVTEKIVRALEVKLVGGAVAREAREQTHDPEAYDCVLRGREQYRLFTKDSNVAARELYERAIALDPDYAEPYAGLAETYVQDWLMGSEPTLDRAFELAQQATARDPNLPLVQEALSTVHLFKKQHAEAVATARRWIELEPGNADAYATLAGAMHLSGENEEVIALIEKAMRLNPHYPFYYPHYIGLANFAMRRFDEAVAALTRGAVRNPEALWPHVYLAACYGHLGEETLASAQLAEVRRINPEFSMAWLLRLLPYKRSADADLLIDGLRKAGLST
ncbi:MAG: adenylate/guanylate cyclase domain-containing protein, partial [Alphaproteobacteria bacterium]